MESIKLKRACVVEPLYRFDSDSSSNGSMGKDPFHCSDDEKDLDFQLTPIKVLRTAAHHDVRTKVRKIKVTKSKSAPPLKLTAAQRIARLKQKTEQYGTANGIQKHFVPLSNDATPSPATNKISTENLDHLFDQVQESGNDVNVGSSSSQNGDSLYSNETINDAITGAKAENESVASIRASLPFQDGHMVKLMLEMRDQMNDFGHSVTMLRKQIARVEVKCSQLGSGMGNSRLRISPNLIDSDMLFDFDGALTREGLPFKAVVEVNDFEKNLASEEYRLKMV